jgi:integrase
MAQKRLDDTLVRNLPVPPKGNRIHYDAPNRRGNDYTPGFGVRITAAGARSFVLNFYNKDGVERRKTIGPYSRWSLAAARDEAKKLKRAIDQGGDPVAEDRERRNAETVSDLCQRFLEEHVTKKRPSTQINYRSIVAVIEEELGSRKVSSIEYADIDRLHRRISKDRGAYSGNRTVAVASKMFALAIRWKMRADNPCKGVERNPESNRERYLTADELARLTAALDEHPNQQAADAFKFLLLTGARSGEAFSAQWNQFDLVAGKWAKASAHTKQKRPHTTPLSPQAQELLQRIRARQDEAEQFVFPSGGESGHLTTLKKSWREVCKAARIANLRVHDLRHSYASFAINAGWSLPVIGALLGHTQPSTTQKYAHLVDDVLARATNTVGAVVSGKKSGSVVPLRRRS